MHLHHRRAITIVSAAAVLDVALGVPFGLADRIGVWNGLYFATTIGTTTGNSPYFPHGWPAYALALAMHLTILPLWLTTFTLITSGLVAGHVCGAEDRIKRHVENRLKHHLGGEQT